MNIEEILNRLERIDHKEYSGGFEFADSSTFDEMGRCFEERKILAKEIERLKEQLNDEIDDELKQSEIMVKQQNEIERLNNIINELEKWLEEAIETISHISLNGASGLHMALNKIKELKGSDKE